MATMRLPLLPSTSSMSCGTTNSPVSYMELDCDVHVPAALHGLLGIDEK